MNFAVLLKSGVCLGLIMPGDRFDRNHYHHVADIEAADLDEAWERCQNDIPPRQDPTGTWAKEPYVSLTSEGQRLRCRKLNDSLRSMCVGDILIDVETGVHWIVAGSGFEMVEDDGIREYIVRTHEA